MSTIQVRAPGTERGRWLDAACEIYHAANIHGETIDRSAIEMLLRPDDDRDVIAFLAEVGAAPVGVMIASTWTEGERRPHAAVDLLGVLPSHRRRGVATHLLDLAVEAARERGATVLNAGGGLRFVAPGPARHATDALAFLEARGFAPHELVWDFAADLRALRETPKADPQVRPATVDHFWALRELLQTEFSTRWARELDDYLSLGGDLGDYLVLVEQREILGFCRISTSALVAGRELGPAWPRPWGELGPIGVAAQHRTSGLGSRLVRTGLAHLADRGVRGCRIGWTTLTGFYERQGFVRTREYVPHTQRLGGEA